jgi:hypothetical protein
LDNAVGGVLVFLARVDKKSGQPGGGEGYVRPGVNGDIED